MTDISTPARSYDAVLASVVATWDDTNPGELPLTLTLPGATVTGHLVGQQTWLRTVYRYEGLWAELSTRLGAMLDEAESPEEPTDDSDDDFRLPGFIHMVKAHYVAGPNMQPVGAGMHWRGRFSEVTSWAIGSLTSD